MGNKGRERGKRVSPVQCCWVAMFTDPSRLLTRHSSICKMIQLLYSWLFQVRSSRGKLCKCWSSCRTFPSLNYWRGMPACLCAPPQPFTYLGCFGCTRSPQQLDSSCGSSVGWQKQENGKIWPLFVMLFLSFFPCNGPHKYLENKCISRLKYQSNSINADPSAGRGWMICPWYCWKFHEVLRIRLIHLSPGYSFCFHSKLPSATINFHPDFLLHLGYHLPFLTKAELDVLVPSRKLVWFHKVKNFENVDCSLVCQTIPPKHFNQIWIDNQLPTNFVKTSRCFR